MARTVDLRGVRGLLDRGAQLVECYRARSTTNSIFLALSIFH